MELRNRSVASRHLQTSLGIEPTRADFMGHLAIGLSATRQTRKTHEVREPLYASAVGSWENYEPQLADLLPLLASAGIKISP